MYAYIDGKLAFKSPSYVVIEAGLPDPRRPP